MFSIILPLYNKESSIESTILSVLNQTLIDFELIVVDDGSKDQSIHLVRNIKDKRLSIYCKENGGVSSARNLGISKAKFEQSRPILCDPMNRSTPGLPVHHKLLE